MPPKLQLKVPGIESQTNRQVTRTHFTSEAEVWVPEATQCYVKVKELGEGVMRSQLSLPLSVLLLQLRIHGVSLSCLIIRIYI
jgi:hypothetical protein